MRNNLTVVLIFLLALSCKEDTLNRTYPLVITNVPSDVSLANVTFSGSIAEGDPSSVVDRGFVWGGSASLSIQSNPTVSLGAPGAGAFTYKLTAGFSEGVQYYVRAYIKTSQLTIYGTAQKFIVGVSDGDAIITDFDPKLVQAGDTLTITGTNFIANPAQENVLFEYDGVTVSAKPTKATETMAKVVVPAGILKRHVSVGLAFGVKVAHAAELLQLKSPGIISVDNATTLCGIMIINWESYGKILTSLSINGTVQQPLTVTPTQITVRLQSLSPAFRVRIEAASFYDDILINTSTSPFDMTAIPTTLNAKDIIILKSQAPIDCAIILASVKGSFTNNLKLIYKSTNELRFVIENYQALKSGFQIEFRTNSTSSVPFFTTQQIAIGNPSPFTKQANAFIDDRVSPGFLTLNGVGYVIGGYNFPGDRPAAYPYSYDFNTDSWISRSDFSPPSVSNSVPSCFSMGSKGYIGHAGSPDFYERSNLVSWGKVTTCPDATSYQYRNISFAIGSSFYVGAGRGPSGSTNLLHEYNTSSNTWTQRPSAPIASSDSTLSFSYNNKGYYYVRKNSTLYRMVYDPTSNSWTMSTSAPPTYFNFGRYFIIPMGTKVLAIDNSGLMTFIDPVNNTWTYAGCAPTKDGVSNTAGFCLVNGNKAVIGQGFYTTAVSHDVWTLDLSKL